MAGIEPGEWSVQPVNWGRIEQGLTEGLYRELTRSRVVLELRGCYAFALELTPQDARLSYGIGVRAGTESELRRLQAEGDQVPYRGVELLPQHWAWRERVPVDPEGIWSAAQDELRRSLASQLEHWIAEEQQAPVAFLAARLERLTLCVVRALTERRAFDRLSREDPFLAYSLTTGDDLAIVEARIAQIYPRFNPSTAGLQLVLLRERTSCAECGREVRKLVACTLCDWEGCRRCARYHAHEPAMERLPLFTTP